MFSVKYFLRGCLTSLRLQSQNFHLPAPDGLWAVNEGQMQSKVDQAKEIIRKACKLFRPEEFMMCFNGGKDSTVLLDLLAKECPRVSPLQAVCVQSFDPFQEVEQFINSSIERYPLNVQRYNGAMKLAIEQALEEHPRVRAIFMGCRRTDLGCEDLSEMEPCASNWPPLVRIFPLLEWSYHDIWSYLRSRDLPYCCLYDQGYTSLGDRSRTTTNPSLLVHDDQTNKLIYLPAYALRNVNLERANL